MSGPELAGEDRDLYDELLRDRIVDHVQHLDGDDLQRVYDKTVFLRVLNGSLSV